MAIDAALATQLKRLLGELDRRGREARRLDKYTDGSCPLPPMIVAAKVTNAYRMLMGLSDAPWGQLVVDSVIDRLIPTGINTGDPDLDAALWADGWQANQMDAESLLAHESALTHGRAFALVWPDSTGVPVISLDSCEQMIVEYEEGSRHVRRAALRRWIDDADGRPYCTLYRRDGLFKFVGAKDGSGGADTVWSAREVPGEPWPAPNPFKVIPAVELPVNRKLRPGAFPFARGEFANATALLDRINVLTFLGLIVAYWQGFPLRALIGDEILKDDNGNDLAPFEIGADSIVQLENPEAKLMQLAAADRGNLSIYGELDQLASVSKTPRYYFPLSGGITNVSADTIRATDGGLVSKMPRHKGSLGEGWEDTLRLWGLMRPGSMGGQIVVPATAAMEWTDHELHSMAERADAAVKLSTILPWQAVAERYLNATQEDVGRWEAMRQTDSLGAIMSGLADDTPTTPAAPADLALVQ